MTYPAITCVRCNAVIDRATLDWFRQRRDGLTPSVCGVCIVVALDELAIECNGEPLLSEKLEEVRT